MWWCKRITVSSVFLVLMIIVMTRRSATADDRVRELSRNHDVALLGINMLAKISIELCNRMIKLLGGSSLSIVRGRIFELDPGELYGMWLLLLFVCILIATESSQIVEKRGWMWFWYPWIDKLHARVILRTFVSFRGVLY